MITLICGDIGSGKTALAAYFALIRMSGDTAVDDTLKLRQYVKQANRSGKNLQYVKDHLVYSDFPIRCVSDYSRPATSKLISGWEIGVANDSFFTVFLPPFSFVVLDEAQKYYSSHVTKGSTLLSPFVVGYYATHRHFFLNFLMTCQRVVSIDKSIRGLAQRFIFPSVHTKSLNGVVVKTIWNCVEFNNSQDAERYNDDKNSSNGQITKYVYNHDIFSSYDSHAHHDTYLQGRVGQDFYFGSDICAISSLDAPFGFYTTPEARKVSEANKYNKLRHH